MADLFGFFDVDPTDRMSVSIWNNAFSGVSIHSEDLSCHHRGVQWPGQFMSSQEQNDDAAYVFPESFNHLPLAFDRGSCCRWFPSG